MKSWRGMRGSATRRWLEKGGNEEGGERKKEREKGERVEMEDSSESTVNL